MSSSSAMPYNGIYKKTCDELYGQPYDKFHAESYDKPHDEPHDELYNDNATHTVLTSYYIVILMYLFFKGGGN
ncbi:5266_t:CDS:2 [Gigaspora rosea]|nr:5266_t:CDS:2 [Gigaspora rosea]